MNGRVVITGLAAGIAACSSLLGIQDPQVGDAGSNVIHDAKQPDTNSCPMEPCTLATQCGCSATTACDLNGSATFCRGVGSGTDTTTCTSEDQCARGYSCIHITGDGSNYRCMKWCDSDSDCAAPRGRCIDQIISSSNQPIPGAVTCTSDCDPTVSSNPQCPSGWACYIESYTDNGSTYSGVDCAVGSTAVQGQTCTGNYGCAPGYWCIAYSPAICQRTCTPPSNAGCPTNTTCMSTSPRTFVGGTEYGYCH